MEILPLIFFFLIIFFAFTLQGITGFAGTVIAMTPCIYIVGYELAKPTVNILGIVAGLFVVLTSRDKLSLKAIRTITIFTVVGVALGFLLNFLSILNMDILYLIFAVFVMYIAVKGIIKSFFGKSFTIKNKLIGRLTLIFAGLIHYFFVTGGVLIVGYASEEIKDKAEFRATMSLLWVILNGIVLISDVSIALVTNEVLIATLITLPAIFGANYVGAKLFHKLSQELFTKISYVIMLVMALILLITGV